jgi:hypothetical protein
MSKGPPVLFVFAKQSSIQSIPYLIKCCNLFFFFLETTCIPVVAFWFSCAVREEMAFPLYDVGNAGSPPVYEIYLHQESAESSSID